MRAIFSRTLAVGAAFSLGLLTHNALATPSFPGVIQGELGLSYMPPCSVCHEGGITGYGTVTTPFGAALRQRGLQAGNEGSLQTALHQLETEKTDSNNDGVPDIDELRQGRDPNTGASLTGPELTYGCGAHLAPGGLQSHGPKAFALAVFFALATLLYRRRF